jgi:predicted nuclease of restriction endonuclease-like (RecB) superfamily
MPPIKANKDYSRLVRDLKNRVRRARIKASLSVNGELILLYWNMARDIVEAQKNAAWGDGFLSQMSEDLQAEFPDMQGFSVRNLQFMKRWYLFWRRPAALIDDSLKTKQLVSFLNSVPKNDRRLAGQLARIPWGHNLVIISKTADQLEAIFYVRKTIENNWSRSVLTHQIEGQLFQREGKALTNFKAKLPKPQSDLAQQLVKDPYNFDFLTIREKHDERELENALMEQVTKFLLELGAGFSFLGRQYRISVEDEDFYIDLLFYHTRLHCFVVVELKSTKFKPEFAGQLNFYVSAVDEILKTPQDMPTIGILICKSKKKTVVEYALKNIGKPIGVSEYALNKALPEAFRSSLPSIAEIEAELDRIKR